MIRRALKRLSATNFVGGKKTAARFTEKNSKTAVAVKSTPSTEKMATNIVPPLAASPRSLAAETINEAPSIGPLNIVPTHPVSALAAPINARTAEAVKALEANMKQFTRPHFSVLPKDGSISMAAFVGLGKNGITKVTRNLRFGPVSKVVTDQEIILAKQEAPQVYSFHIFHDAPRMELAQRILAVPQAERNLHVVCGRLGLPCDLYIDIDDCLQNDGHRTVLDVIQQAEKEIVALGHKAEKVVVLTGNSPVKNSFHVHIRLQDAVFADFRMSRDLCRRINEKLGINAIDLQVFRYNAMFRVAFCSKVGIPGRILTPLRSSHLPGLQAYLDKMATLSDAEIVEMSFINRAPSPTAEVIMPPRIHDARVYDQNGRVLPRFMQERNKFIRLKEAVAEMAKYPLEFVERYDTWIRIGLSLHSFGHEDHIFAHWERLSARCAIKFDRRILRKRWEYFAKRRNCFNWQRGYNYLTKTIYGPSNSQLSYPSAHTSNYSSNYSNNYAL